MGSALVDLEQDDSGATAVLGTGETVRAGWLVGCDGTSSTTRTRAGIGFPGVQVSEPRPGMIGRCRCRSPAAGTTRGG